MNSPEFFREARRLGLKLNLSGGIMGPDWDLHRRRIFASAHARQ